MVANDEKLYGPLLPLNEAAEFIGVSPHTLRGWIQAGKIESHKLWGKRLVSEDELIRIIEMSRIPARSETRPQVNLPGTARGRADRR
jgi:excisionase family DNA binding protein